MPPVTSDAPLGPRLAHPLSGADLITLIRVLIAGGGVERQRMAQAAVALGSSIGRLPFTLGERAYLAARTTVGAPRIERPIFIIGHWRSGTTHLFNLMSRSRQFSWLGPLETGMPWESLSLVPLLRPLLERALPDHRFIDSIPVNPDSPQEDEVALANMTPASFYHALYFPRRFDALFDQGVFLSRDRDRLEWRRAFLQLSRKVVLQNPGRTLMVKNPVYTARVLQILSVFPDARFIHIHRNPHEVFRSMRNFHTKLLREFSLQPSQAVDIDRVVLRTYARMMSAMARDTRELPPNRFLEIGYAELDQAPLATLEKIYTQLEIPDFSTDADLFTNYLQTVDRYQKNHYIPDPDAARMVLTAWEPFFERFGYAKSGAAA